MSTVSSFEGDVRKPKGAVLFTGSSHSSCVKIRYYRPKTEQAEMVGGAGRDRVFVLTL